MLLLDISTSAVSKCRCSQLDCIRLVESLNEWETRQYAIVHTETMLGRKYGYCMHAIPEFSDIQSNAILISIGFWYKFDTPAHAVIEAIFRCNDKFLTAFLEGLYGIEDNIDNGMVSCHQYYGNSSNIGTKYLKGRSNLYRLLHTSEVSGVPITYLDAFDGVIKEINEFYVGNKWIASEIIDGTIKLNHGCLWYAFNLVSKLTNISADELLKNENISKPIICFKKCNECIDS